MDADIALREVCLRWYCRYRVPLPYHTLVDPETLRECMQITSVGIGGSSFEPIPPQWDSERRVPRGL